MVQSYRRQDEVSTATAQVTGGGTTYLKPRPMLFVIPPGLPLQLSGSQILLVSARHVVKRKEEGLRVQLLK